MTNETIGLIATSVLALVAILGYLAIVLKGSKVLTEVGHVLKSVGEAVADGKVTADEVLTVKTEIGELKAAIKDLKQKKL